MEAGTSECIISSDFVSWLTECSQNYTQSRRITLCSVKGVTMQRLAVFASCNMHLCEVGLHLNHKLWGEFDQRRTMQQVVESLYCVWYLLHVTARATHYRESHPGTPCSIHMCIGSRGYQDHHPTKIEHASNRLASLPEH